MAFGPFYVHRNASGVHIELPISEHVLTTSCSRYIEMHPEFILNSLFLNMY